MRGAVESPPVAFVVELINGWAEVVRHRPEPRSAYPSRSTLASLGGVAIPRTETDRKLAALGDTFYDIFAAAPHERIDRMNRVLADTPVLASLTGSGIGWRSEAGVVATLAAAALLGHARIDPELARLGVCRGHRCRDAFVDTSQAHTRRFCTERCQTRSKARRRRAARG